MKKFLKGLSIILISTLIAGCEINKTPKSNNSVENSSVSNSESNAYGDSSSANSGDTSVIPTSSSNGGNSSSNTSAGGQSSKSSSNNSSSSSHTEEINIDTEIRKFLNGTSLTVPALSSYDIDYDVYYYYEYGAYFIAAVMDDATNTFETTFNNLVSNISSWVVYNDEDYTVEEYGYMYADNFDNASIELDFYNDEGVFYLTLYRWDGEHGTLDVSNVDTSWYVDYVNFYGFVVGDTFPVALIKEHLGAANANIPTLDADEYVYGANDEYVDEYGDLHKKGFNVLFNGDVMASYASKLTTAGYTVTKTTEEGFDWDTFETYEYDIYTGYDADHKLYFSMVLSGEVTLLVFNLFSDVYVDTLTTNTDWDSSEKGVMNTYLGEVLPFQKFGTGYNVEQMEDSWGDTLVVIEDNYYQDLTGQYATLLLQNGFKLDSTTYSNPCYVKDNKKANIEIFLNYSDGNVISAYYSASSYVEATSVTLDKDTLDIVAGGQYQFTSTLAPQNATSSVAYSVTENTTWCSISANGLLTVNADATVGATTTVTVTTEEGKTDTCVVTVVADAVVDFTLASASVELSPADTYTIEISEVLPIGVNYTKAFAVTEGDNTKISVSDAGVVTISESATFGSTFKVTVTVGTIAKDVTITIVEKALIDVLNQTTLGLAGNSTYGTHTYTGPSGVSYTAECASTHGIQIRSKNKDSGIIGGSATKVCKTIEVVFNKNTAKNKVLNIYASNTAFTIADMFNKSKMTPITTLTYDGSNATMSYTFTENYHYIGIASDDGAIYLDSITLNWK